MRAVIQKVTHARVDTLEADRRETVGQIQHGLMVLLGVSHADSEADARYIADKTANLRIFEDDAGKLNLSLKDIGGAVLLVSQFTLYADTRKGNRPSFTDAAPPQTASPLVDHFVAQLRAIGIPTQTGEFGAHMLVALENDGPVTIWIEN